MTSLPRAPQGDCTGGQDMHGMLCCGGTAVGLLPGHRHVTNFFYVTVRKSATRT